MAQSAAPQQPPAPRPRRARRPRQEASRGVPTAGCHRGQRPGTKRPVAGNPCRPSTPPGLLPLLPQAPHLGLPPVFLPSCTPSLSLNHELGAGLSPAGTWVGGWLRGQGRSAQALLCSPALFSLLQDPPLPPAPAGPRKNSEESPPLPPTVEPLFWGGLWPRVVEDPSCPESVLEGGLGVPCPGLVLPQLWKSPWC